MEIIKRMQNKKNVIYFILLHSLDFSIGQPSERKFSTEICMEKLNDIETTS